MINGNLNNARKSQNNKYLDNLLIGQRFFGLLLKWEILSFSLNSLSSFSNVLTNKSNSTCVNSSSL